MQRESAAKKGHYKGRVKQWRRHIREENRAFINEYLKTRPCIDCGESDTTVLEFDHVRGEKLFDISDGVWQHRWAIVAEEIKKCDVRCANCHRLQTIARADRLSWYINKTPMRPPKSKHDKIYGRNMPLVMEYLESHPCVDCGNTNPLVLDFDHVRGQKLFSVSMQIQFSGWQRLVDEIAKCEVRCANCHQRKHRLG